MDKLVKRIRGEAELELFGVFPEAVISRCGAEGITLRQVVSLDGQTLRCRVDERELERLRSIAARCQCEVRLLSLRGGSRYRAFLRRRLWLPAAAAAVLAALLLSSLFIWDVEVYGNCRLSRGRILRALADAGVESGCFWPALSTDLVRSRALAALPELAWLTVNVNGSRALVLVEEREEKPEIYRESSPCSLAAAHSGIVRRVSVLNGRALVQPGQAVQQGETLVVGRLDSLVGAERYVRARGEVWADTWYELTALRPRPERWKGAEAGRLYRLAVKIGKKRINFYAKSRKTLDGYDKIVHEYNLGVKGLFALPVSLVCETFTHRAGAEETAPDPKESYARLEEYLCSGLEGEIVGRAFACTEKDGLLCVMLRARCFENIAKISEAEDTSP